MGEGKRGQGTARRWLPRAALRPQQRLLLHDCRAPIWKLGDLGPGAPGQAEATSIQETRDETRGPAASPALGTAGAASHLPAAGRKAGSERPSPRPRPSAIRTGFRRKLSTTRFCQFCKRCHTGPPSPRLQGRPAPPEPSAPHHSPRLPTDHRPPPATTRPQDPGDQVPSAGIFVLSAPARAHRATDRQSQPGSEPAPRAPRPRRGPAGDNGPRLASLRAAGRALLTVHLRAAGASRGAASPRRLQPAPGGARLSFTRRRRRSLRGRRPEREVGGGRRGPDREARSREPRAQAAGRRSAAGLCSGFWAGRGRGAGLC